MTYSLPACRDWLIKRIDSVSENKLCVIFTGLAFLIAFRVMLIQQGWINADSVLYFEVARLFSIGEWKEGLHHFSWPLYPVLIGGLHKLTGLGFEAAAQWLNAIFFAITTFSFITLIRLAGGNKTTMMFGAALLFGSSYIVGDVLPMLLRDQGFWAFLLTSVVFYIKFYRDNKLQDALLWQISCILAMLFRVEAITFLVLLPFLYLKNASFTKKERLTGFIKASALSILLVIALLVMLIAIPSLSFTDLGRIPEALVNLQDMAAHFSEKSALMGKKVLGPYLDNYGTFGLAITLIGIAFLKTIKTAGWVSIGLLTLNLGDKKGLQIKSDAKLIFIVVSILALLNMAAILLRAYVLSSRYIIALAFMLLIFSSFAFTALFNSVKAGSVKTHASRLRKWLLVIAILVLSLIFIKNIAPKPSGYAFEKEAVTWVIAHTPKGSSIFYVSPRARYYAGEPYAGRYYEYWDYVMQAIKDGSISQYDYLVINLDKEDLGKQKQLEELLKPYALTREFVGYKGKKKILFFSRK